MAINSFSNGFSGGFGSPLARGYLRLDVGFYPTYEDGDIISAINWRFVRSKYAEQVCWSRGKNRFDRVNSHGFLNHTDVLKDWCENIYQFRFDRLSASEARVVRLSDNNIINFETNKPFVQHDGKTVQMDINLTMGRKIKTFQNSNVGQGIPVFSDDGDVNKITYYGGRQDLSHSKLDIIWPQIESKLGILEQNIPAPVFSDRGRKTLTIAVDDFSDSAALTNPLVDDTDPDNPITIKKRKFNVNWRLLRDVVEGDVTNSAISVDIANIRKHVRSEIILSKTI